MTDTERIEQIEQYIPYFFLTRHIKIAKCKKKKYWDGEILFGGAGYQSR